MLTRNTINQIRAYLAGTLDDDAFWKWLAEAEYRADGSAEERDMLARLRLLAIEADEGLRPERDLRVSAIAMLKADTGCQRPDSVVVSPLSRISAYLFDWAANSSEEINLDAISPGSTPTPFEGPYAIGTGVSSPADAAQFAA